jgi:uracil-DNA glycosylase
MFALVNFLLCSAIAADESERGSKHGRSTPTMQENCARHFVRAIEILEPTLMVAQGKGTAQWIRSTLKDDVAVSANLRSARIGDHSTLLATFSHPSAQGQFNWADLSRPYLHDVVTPTIQAARQLLTLTA